eukprot:TRINITY_DN6958_c2_g1_i1.p1 TRINITY_DN6958_c2_g1~~TRINITY_DN6958_c2_g1_i1.p1  ORF type:complete len:457 (+),score=100.93 TRINITY_DN6958_c2_g1_i1:33-1373(+)
MSQHQDAVVIPILDNGGSSSDGGDLTMRIICIVLAVIYGLLWLRSIQVIVNFLRMKNWSPAGRTVENSTLVANDSPANYGLSGNHQPEKKPHQSSRGKVMFHFYIVLSLLSLGRMITWSMAAGMSDLEGSNVELAVVAIPSLFYFMMLFILVNSWWCAYDALKATTGSPEESSIQGRMRKPALGLMSLLWLVTIILYIYLITAKKLTSDEEQQNVMLGYTGALFFVIGLLFVCIGYSVHAKLGELPYNYPGTKQLKHKVRRITIWVGPSCILRALFTVFQLAPDNNFLSHFVNSDFFGLAFYLCFEIIPILAVMSTLQTYYKIDEEDNNDDSPAASPSRQVTVAPGIASRVTVDQNSSRTSLQPTLGGPHASSAGSGLNLKIGGRKTLGPITPSQSPVERSHAPPPPQLTTRVDNPEPPVQVPTAHSNGADQEDFINRSNHHYLQA